MIKRAMSISLAVVICLFTGKTLYAQSSNAASAAPVAIGEAGGGTLGQEGDGLKLSLTPNPATNEVTCNYESASSQNTSMIITDGTGANVMKMSLGTKQKGNISLTLGNLAKGVYMIELVSGAQKATQRLVKE